MTCCCADRHCPAHEGSSRCDFKATTTLWRVDMDGGSLEFCEACAEDAMKSGLFTDDPVMSNEDSEER